jgi:hypothetical protein
MEGGDRTISEKAGKSKLHNIMGAIKTVGRVMVK